MRITRNLLNKKKCRTGTFTISYWSVLWINREETEGQAQENQGSKGTTQGRETHTKAFWYLKQQAMQDYLMKLFETSGKPIFGKD